MCKHQDGFTDSIAKWWKICSYLALEETSKSHPNLESRKVSSMEIINCIACVGGSENGEGMYPIIINSRGMAVYLQLHVSLKTKDRLKDGCIFNRYIFTVIHNVFILHKNQYRWQEILYFIKLHSWPLTFAPELYHRSHKIPFSKVSGIAPLNPILRLFSWFFLL